jgi:hypothetical protein
MQSRVFKEDYNELITGITTLETPIPNTRVMLSYIGSKVTFLIIRVNQLQNQLADYKQLSRDCHFLCCSLLKDQAVVSRSPIWDEWRLGYLLLSSQSENISIHISELPSQLSGKIVSVVCSGTYAIMYMSDECAIVMDGYVQSGRLVPIVACTERLDLEEAMICTGYYSATKFSLVSSMYSKSLGLRQSGYYSATKFSLVSSFMYSKSLGLRQSEKSISFLRSANLIKD